MALENGGRKKMLFQGGQASAQRNLVWSYDAKQFDLNEGATVKGRRHYTVQELKAIAATERQKRAHEEQLQLERKKAGPRRRRIEDDDED